MRHTYQPTKSLHYSVNFCAGCLEKQREIDRLKEEVTRLRSQLSRKKRQDAEGFFGSSTSSAKQPVKANSPEVERNKNGGAKPGHEGFGRRRHSTEQADEVQTINTDESQCPQCTVSLWHHGFRQRSVLA